MTKLFIILIFALFGSQTAVVSDAAREPYAASPSDASVKLDAENVQLKWSGSKVTGGGHHGVLDIQSGSLKLNDKGRITDGEFLIDMNTLEDKDLKSGEGKEKLEGHLKSPDFFEVKKYPTAKFDITSVTPKGGNKHEIKGNLTVRGKTNSITFPAEINVMKKAVKAEAEFTFDRTKHGVMFHSKEDASWWDEGQASMKDMAISDDVKLEITLSAKR